MFWRRIIILTVLVFLVAFNYSQRAGASDPAPGTAADPLVTQGYVDRYLEQAFGQLREQLAYLESQTHQLRQRVQALEAQLIPPITFTIGSAVARQGEETINLALAPYTKEGRTMLPFRVIGEAMGAQVDWQGATRQVTFRRDKVQVTLSIGAKEAQVNGETTILEVAPELTDATTMVPLRFVADALGARLAWQPDTRQVIIYP